ncbi:uncharacterized protein LOC120112380 [Phoenix dactylifera]|uniref:Uncharacterized protein LOC120112380 n=1 Tax=Phoenix dactylifera TaxID=42345 RepID=A0A8B9API0_PHODC|nr:uncharacterized protein LOC120112380 [Phoenix dactylifera]
MHSLHNSSSNILILVTDGSIRRNLPFNERDSSRSQVIAPCIEPSISPSTSASKAGPSSLKTSQTSNSQVGSFDVWPSVDISKLMSSFQGETWSFGSGHSSYCTNKLANSSTQLSSTSLYSDSQMCRVCSKVLNDRSLWSSQKLVLNKEISVVAILVCGHVFHANCLEIMMHATEV